MPRSLACLPSRRGYDEPRSGPRLDAQTVTDRLRVGLMRGPASCH